jgi:hypothetical protein
MDFESFQKIGRLSREMIVTEKLDGTNAQVCITEDGDMFFGSRTRWITPQDDNFGFARWAEGNKSELMKLGPGRHYGEWWGHGIQRGYGLTEKRFSLFNTSRWTDDDVRPACCHVVPELFVGSFSTSAVEGLIAALRVSGSVAAPGFMKPEGVVVFHPQSRAIFKKTLEKDDQPKALAA